MPAMLDDGLDELLREAEQRMRKSSVPCRPPQSELATSVFPLAQSPTASQASLAVRQPQAAPSRAGSKKDTAGPNWFHLPKTDLTPEFKRDWQLLRMRGLLDPKHQKKALSSAPPGYSQVGEVISGPADSYGSRLTRKEKRRTIFEQVTAAHDGDKLKGKYAGIQRSKASGKKAFYQRVVSARRKRQN